MVDIFDPRTFELTKSAVSLEQARRANLAATPASMHTDIIEVLREEIRRLENELRISREANMELRTSNAMLSQRVLEASLPGRRRR